MGDKVLLLSSDAAICDLVSKAYRKISQLIESRSMDAFNSEIIFQADYNKIIVDNREADLTIVELAERIDNEAKMKKKDIKLLFIDCYYERDIAKKTLKLENLSGALYNYAWELQWRAGKDSSINYGYIVKAYIRAAEEGSARAMQWLKEQKMPYYVKPNSLWSKPYWPSQVNNRFIDEINSRG